MYFLKKTYSGLLLWPLLFLIPITASAQEKYRLDTVHLQVDEGYLEGSLLRPWQEQPLPLAIIIAGSGPTDRDGNNPMMKNDALKMLAEGLAERGIASLRYDKRGIGGSHGAIKNESELRFDTYAADAAAWVQKMEDSLDFSEIIMIGHSEGSLLGMLAAGQSPVDKFVSIAGAGQPANLILRQQLAAQPPHIQDPALVILERLEAGEKVSEISPMLQTIFRPSVQPYLISWFNYDPQEEIAKLKIPVLIVQGTTDLQVEVDDAHLLKEAQAEARLEIIQGMNHIMKPAPEDQQQNLATYYSTDIRIIDQVVEVIADFIK
ncbi:MAG: alpha/beta hydrolase [Cyclobacteriaceae bacterium]